MSLFRLDASMRVEGSHSRQIADIVEQQWRAAHPHAQVVTRHIGTEPLPATAWATAVGAAPVPAEQRSPEQRAAVALATELVDEMADADALLFAVPLYNFGVSQHFKTWVDLVFTEPRMAPGGDVLITGKPAVLVTVRGGSYAPGTPRHGWDHATGWMQRILRDVWQLDLKTVESELTMVGANPALDEFTELAANLRAAAEEQARQHGRSLAGALAA